MNKLKPAGNELRNFQPVFIEDATYGFPEKFIKQFNLVSMLIVPIYVPEEGKVIGGILLDKGPERKFERDRSLVSCINEIGANAGELLLRFTNPENSVTQNDLNRKLSFSSHEVDIIKLLAAGASTTEVAVQLYLSEYTVREYISTIMRRLDAKNRTEVAVKAIRMGIID
ncbi:LuxR C-terminal-related transcriptional regulator [Bacillus sp. D386]|uniref:LuxR C-terminal-related transcriptional regulator n=1 Tax=Bacillus sp. D386 TaxID=2587155 RepID=UPI0011213AA2|nr:LuxR C-terminal-related transcriptional regulator [Bacillus sp. D386]